MFVNVNTKDLVMWRVNIPKDNEEKIEQLRNNEKTIEELGGIKIKYMTERCLVLPLRDPSIVECHSK